jgi:hypothetical protein
VPTRGGAVSVPRQAVSVPLVRARVSLGGLDLVVASAAAFAGGWLVGYLAGLT